MGVIRKKNPNTGEWEICGSSDAKDINLIDVGNNFETKTVEGALREVSDDLSEMMALLNAQKGTLVEHSNAIAWLKENGGGGGGGTGGAIAPTITSNFEDGAIVTKEEDVEIDIFFTSPNLGEGTAYVIIDNIEVASIAGIKQGNNLINIGKLTNLKNKVSIYVKDRANMISNQLNWTIISGGIELEVIFDDTADYYITDQIFMQFDVNSASDEPIVMHMQIDFDEYEVPCKQGFNEYYFPEMGIGIHSIQMYITSGPYKTPVNKFNIVVVSSNSLYVSSTFENGSEIALGNPVQIQYRISKASDETFTVNQYLNDKLIKTLNCVVGAYYWTLNDLDIGSYKVKIEIIGKYDEPKIIELEFEVVASGYVPVKVTEAGLIYRLSAKGRTNQDSDREQPEDNSGRGVTTTLHDFNWYTNGWIDGELVCDSNAYVEIDLKPWEDNAIYGSTIEIQYSSIDIGYTDSRIFDYTDVETPYKGAYIDIEKTVMKSLANTGEISLDKGVDTTISFVIDRRNKFGKIFVNGICSRAFFLSDTGSGTSAKREDFTHSQKIYLNSRKGIDCFGACKIKDVRVYSRVLSDDEIVTNYISQISDLKEQERMYNFNFDNTTLPVIRMYGDTTNMTLETPVTMRIKYTSPNEDYYGQSFDLPYCQVNWQGTSSLQYVLKNFTARLKDENMAPFYYTPYPGGIPEDTFCFKADYMESTHSRNVGIAKFVNECLYDSKNPMQLKDPKIRNTVIGFPCLMYINDELQGVYNFNLDRYSTKPFGYTDPDKTLVYEVSANSDTTAGAFYKWTEASGKDKLSYYKSDFECVYPPTRAAGNDNMSELIRLVDWVNDSSDEDFRDNFEKYFNKEYVLRYYLFVLVFGAVDSLGKNMKLSTWDGLIWYPQVYDADTTIGLDNTGFLKFDMDIEMGDHQVFNTTGSMLWKRVIELFQPELKQQYSLMRQDRFTVDNIMKYLYGEQISKIPAYYYNKDMQTKYLDFGSAYLYALHGNGEQHIKKWIRERIMYCDTLLGYNVSSADYITLRSSKLGYVYLDIQTYIPMYVSVKWRDEANNTGLQTKRVGRGETVRFEYNMPTETDQEIIVYAGHYLKSLGDVSNLQPTTMLIANADRLTEIECHSPNLINTDLSECTLLQKIDLSDCTALGTGIGAQPTLNITGCKYLRVCNCYNTQLTAIYTMQAGGNLEEIYYPESIQQIVLTNQTYLKHIAIPWEANRIYCKNLAKVQIENCKAVETIHYPFSSGEGLIFDALRYTQDLLIKDSLDGLTEMTFQGFSKLKSISLAAMYNLAKLGFDDMMGVSETSALSSIVLSECPLIKEITFNLSSDLNKIEFAPKTVIDLSRMQSVTSIRSNATIKGLETLIVPKFVTTIDFNNEYGNGESDIINIWSGSVNHSNDNYEGIDFLDMHITDLNMAGLKKIVNGLNFNLTLTNKHPHMNDGRDGKRLPYFKPEGNIDISNYSLRTGMQYLFKGVDLGKLNIITATGQLQDDLTGLFEDAIVPDINQFMIIMNCYPLSDVWDYVLSGAQLGFDSIDVDFPSDRLLSVRGFFMNTGVSTDFVIPSNFVCVSELFKGCTNMIEYVYNWDLEHELGDELETEECYFGTGGDLELVDPAWGGLGFYPSVISEIEIKIPTNNYTVTLVRTANKTSASYVTWGDGSMSKLIDVDPDLGMAYSHKYAKAGVYRIRGHFTFGNGYEPHDSIKSLISKVFYIAKGEEGAVLNLSKAFVNCSNLEEINLSDIKVHNLSNAFSGCSKLSTVNFNNFDTNSVTSMKSLFQYCEALTSLDLSQFDTTNVTDMSYMFAYCEALTNINVSSFNTKQVTNMNSMFRNCKALTELDVSNFNTESVTNMAHMFSWMMVLGQLDLSNFNTAKVTTMENMFAYNYELRELNISSFDTSQSKNMKNMFNTTQKLESLDVSHFNTENVTNMEGMFGYSKIIKNLDLSNFNTKNVKYMASMFAQCESLTDITWNSDTFITDNVVGFNSMFAGCKELISVDVSKFNTANSTNFTFAFSNCPKLESLDLSNWNTKLGKTMNSMFFGCSKLKNIDFGPNFITSSATDCSLMFSGCSSLTSINTSIFDFTNTTNIRGLFTNCSSITDLNLLNLNTSSIQNMRNLFEGCRALVNLNISNFNTENVTTMKYMFKGCNNLKTLDLSNFNTGKAQNMAGLFQDCNSLESITFGQNFVTTNVVSISDSGDNENINGFDNMFAGCRSLKSIDLSNFNTNKSTSFKGMFYDCSSLPSIDLSKFDFTNIQNTSTMFKNCTSLGAIDLSGHTTNKLENVQEMFNNFGGTSINMQGCNFSNVTNAKTFAANTSKLTTVIPPSSIKTNIEFSGPLLTADSLVAIIDSLIDTGSVKTLTIGATNQKKLSADQIAVAINKNWTVA